MRHTKIVATLGPATNTEPVIAELIAAGVDVFRLNFSHGSHDAHAALIAHIRKASAAAGRHVAILQDLSGPKIRTGPLQDGRPLPLAPGDRLDIVTGTFAGGPGRVSTSYAPLARSVTAGDRLLCDDRRIELAVTASDGTTIQTTVVNGGELGEHKGINAPGVALPVSALTDKDVADLQFGIAQGVDCVALSFVQTADDVRAARRIIEGSSDPGVVLVAKIERPAAVANLDAILEAADAVMVARGDLGLEMPLEQVPRVQKEITRAARVRSRPVVVATQVLDSMRTEPRPTRAEVSDAANAVDDLVDAIMLSGETAVGRYPVQAVRTLDAVIRDAESARAVDGAPPLRPSATASGLAHNRALCEAAVTLAAAGQAAAIVAMTRGGKTPRELSTLRPNLPVLAACTSAAVARRLALWRHVVPHATDLRDLDATGHLVERNLVDRGALARGDLAVYVNANPDLTRIDANFLSIRQVN